SMCSKKRNISQSSVLSRTAESVRLLMCDHRPALRVAGSGSRVGGRQCVGVLCAIKYFMDVAVVGAGLAGLYTAKLLAARGAPVLLVDRQESLAAPTHTTGIFVRKTWEDFPLPAEQLGPPIRDVYLYSPALRCLRLTSERDDFRIGRMEWLYASMLDACCGAGVTWPPSATLIACEPGRVVVSRKNRREAY